MNIGDIHICLVCGKELSYHRCGGQKKYCGPVCAKVADAKKRSSWAKNLTVEQLRHWYAT